MTYKNEYVVIPQKEYEALKENQVVHCKDCKNLMFSDSYGECKKGYMGIVNANDYCSHAVRKGD